VTWITIWLICGVVSFALEIVGAAANRFRELGPVGWFFVLALNLLLGPVFMVYRVFKIALILGKVIGRVRTERKIAKAVRELDEKDGAEG
jgi:hypothetical protein